MGLESNPCQSNAASQAVITSRQAAPCFRLELITVADAAVEHRVSPPVGMVRVELANVQHSVEVARQNSGISSLVSRGENKHCSHHQQGSAAVDRYSPSPARVESSPASPGQKVSRYQHRN